MDQKVRKKGELGRPSSEKEDFDALAMSKIEAWERVKSNIKKIQPFLKNTNEKVRKYL